MSATAEQSKIGSGWLTPIELTSLGAVWGGSFLFMRIAAGDFGPFALVEVRLSLGALVLLPFLWRSRSSFAPRVIWRLAGIGIINSAIPFVLFAWGAERAPAGIGAITNAMTVLFTALMAFVLYREPIGRQRMIGLLTGFVGVLVLAADKTGGGSVWPAALAGTLAALFYGVALNLIRHYLAGVPASAVAAATLLSASVFVAPFALLSWPRRSIPLHSWVSAIALGVICTDQSDRRFARLDRDLSRTAVRRRVGLDRARRATHHSHGRGCDLHPRGRRSQPAQLGRTSSTKCIGAAGCLKLNQWREHLVIYTCAQQSARAGVAQSTPKRK